MVIYYIFLVLARMKDVNFELCRNRMTIVPGSFVSKFVWTNVIAVEVKLVTVLTTHYHSDHSGPERLSDLDGFMKLNMGGSIDIGGLQSPPG